MSTTAPGSAPDAETPARAHGTTGLTVLWILVLLSVLPWRKEAYFSGGLDPVVLAKSVLGGLTLASAWFVWGSSRLRSDLGLRSIVLVLGYLVVTVMGGWAAGAEIPSAVLAVRVAMLLATVLLLVSASGVAALVVAARNATMTVALVVAVTGAPQFAAEGRLGGGLLPLSPNVLSMMFGFVVIVYVWQLMQERVSAGGLCIALVLLGLVWLTGSRTGLVALLLAVGVAALVYSRRPSGLFAIAAVAPPALLYVVTSTGLAEAYFSRGGGESVMTLNSRTIAWKAAFDQPYEFWQFWFGRGLSAKTVGVSGTFWDTQVLDSSWVSAYVQGGLLGVSIMALWVLTTIVGCCRLPQPDRALFLALAVFALMWSVTASGLLDSYALFLIMLLASLSVDQTSRDVHASPDRQATPLVGSTLRAVRERV